MKKILLLFLCVLSFNAIHADVTWNLSDDGTLTISGTGNMENYHYYSSSSTTINSPWYSERNKIKKVVIKKGVTSIGDYAFANCTNLSSVTIVNSVSSIGNNAFACCSSLTSVILSNSVSSIGENAFNNCSNLTSITLPNTVTSIGEACFSYCNSLISFVIPKSVKTIGADMFRECSDLTSITIPEGVQSIGDRAFLGCNRLNNVVIPSTVKSLGDGVFMHCTKLEKITCNARTTPSVYENTFLYTGIKDGTLFVPAVSVYMYETTRFWKNWKYIKANPATCIPREGEPYANDSQLSEQNISYTRTFNNTNWQALYIPFSLSYEDWKDDFDVAYINGVRQLDKDDNGTIDETIMDVIKIKSGSTTPNMPYLIKAKTTGEKTFSVSNATLYAAEENSLDCSTTIAKYTFTGTYSSIPSETMIANNYYAMGGGDLIQSDGSNDLKPYRWYMKVESRNPSYNVSNAAKSITINVIGNEEEETTTGVKELRITNDELPVYDINGRMVSDKNLKPGLYIKNGKKFVVK